MSKPYKTVYSMLKNLMAAVMVCALGVCGDIINLHSLSSLFFYFLEPVIKVPSDVTSG